MKGIMFSRRHFITAFGSAFTLGAYAEPLKRREGEILIAHCTDPQFGMGMPRAGKRMTEEGYSHDLDRCLSAIETINALGPDLVCITGDMTHEMIHMKRDWPRLLKMYHAPVVVSPGNHDVGNRIDPKRIEAFADVFGAECRSVKVKDWRVISCNSMHWWPNKFPELREKHDRWFYAELAGAKERGEKVIVAMHVPPFMYKLDEADNHSNHPLEGRLKRLDACIDAGARFILAGHTHRYAEHIYKNLHILNAETTCLNSDRRPFGFRLLRIHPDGSYDYDFVPVKQGPELPRQLFSVMSFNIRHGEGMDGKLDLVRTAAAISREKPRFVGLCEVDCRTKRSGGVDQAKELARLTGMHPTFGPAIDFQGGKYGVAVLSCDRPVSSRQIPLPGKEPRTLLLVEFEDCAVGVTHLSVSAASERQESVELMRNALAAQSGKPVFLMGDWNSRPQSEVLAEMRKFVKVISDETGRTYHGRPSDGPAAEQEYCIDYIAMDSAHAREWKVVSRQTVKDETTSDHKPITVTVSK